MLVILERMISWYLASALLALLLLLLFYRIRDALLRKRENKYIYRCKKCGYIYLLSKNMPLQSCPRCGQFNEVFRN
jgi:rRNA maturation endonuclease Nob1